MRTFSRCTLYSTEYHPSQGKAIGGRVACLIVVKIQVDGVKKAANAARKKRTIAHLPKSMRTALGKQAASVARRKKC